MDRFADEENRDIRLSFTSHSVDKKTAATTNASQNLHHIAYGAQSSIRISPFEQKLNVRIGSGHNSTRPIHWMLFWIRLLKLEIVIEKDTCRDDARFVGCEEAARAGLTADAVDKVVGCGLHGLLPETYLVLRSEVS